MALTRFFVYRSFVRILIMAVSETWGYDSLCNATREQRFFLLKPWVVPAGPHPPGSARRKVVAVYLDLLRFSLACWDAARESSPKRRQTLLVISRRVNETIVIDGDIRVTVVSIQGGKVRLGIEAPASICVDREEIHERRRQFSEKMPSPSISRCGTIPELVAT